MAKIRRSSASGLSRKFAARHAGGLLFLRLAGAFHGREEPPRHLHLSAVEPGRGFQDVAVVADRQAGRRITQPDHRRHLRPQHSPLNREFGSGFGGGLGHGRYPATRCCTATAAGGVDGAGRSFRCPAPHRQGSYPCTRAPRRSCRPPCGRRRHSHCRNACPRAFSHCPWPAPLHGRHRQGSFRRW